MSVDEVAGRRSGRLRIGTRGSQLARWQSGWVADRLRELHPGLDVELVEIKTQGDRDRNSPLSVIGGTGLFTKEIQRALLDGSVDLAVHSLKDLPTDGPSDLVLGAVPEREDVADALIAPVYKSLAELPLGATVGTGSLRRRAMLLHARPDLKVVGLRGNVDTRLKRASDGTLDAVVLAAAGLRRLGLDQHVTQWLTAPEFLPAVGQGALGIECRAEDTETQGFLAPLNHEPTRQAALAERECLNVLGGGCLIPLGAYARAGTQGVLRLSAAVLDPDGKVRLDAESEGPATEPLALGSRVAALLKDQGADRILALVRSAESR